MINNQYVVFEKKNEWLDGQAKEILSISIFYQLDITAIKVQIKIILKTIWQVSTDINNTE